MTRQANDSTTCISRETYSNSPEAQHKQAINFILNDASTAAYDFSPQTRHAPSATISTGSLSDKDFSFNSTNSSEKRLSEHTQHDKATNEQSTSLAVEAIEDSSCSESEEDDEVSGHLPSTCCRAAQIELKEYKKRITALMALVTKQTNEIQTLRSILHSHDQSAEQGKETHTMKQPSSSSKTTTNTTMACHCQYARKRNKQF